MSAQDEQTLDIRKPHGIRIEAKPTPLTQGRMAYTHLRAYRFYKHNHAWAKAGPVLIPVRYLVWVIEGLIGLEDTMKATPLPETLPPRFEIDPYRDIHEKSDLGVKCTVKRKHDGTPYFWAHLYNHNDEGDVAALSLFEGHVPHLIEGLLEARNQIEASNSELANSRPQSTLEAAQSRIVEYERALGRKYRP